jgi:protein-tyrosine phosphatase
MSPKYCLIFLLLALALVGMAWALEEFIGPWSWLSFYLALSFAIVAAAYGGGGPKLLMKRPSGRRSAVGRVLLGPYLLLNTGLLSLHRLLSREPACVQVAPNLWFGRRLTAREARQHIWIGVLDLAAEFAEVRPLRESPGYRSLPILDATAPTASELNAAVGWITEAVEKGPVYVHCALGHGRSACVVIGYLRSVGVVRSVEAGVRRLQSMRSGVRLHRDQRRRLEQWSVHH